jgi:hypothetical protein
MVVVIVGPGMVNVDAGRVMVLVIIETTSLTETKVVV